MKDLKISKELLSEVLKKEIENRDISYVEIYKNVVIYKVSIYDREEEINIYELAHKCKEWLADSEVDYTLWRTHKHRFYSEKYYLDIESDTEHEAIFKACEWVLKEAKNNI